METAKVAGRICPAGSKDVNEGHTSACPHSV